MSYLVLGASGGLGRALCRELAASGRDLIVVSSDERDLNALASDLALRFGVRVRPARADVARGGYLEGLRVAAEEMAPLRGLLFPVGAVLSEDRGGLPPECAERLVRVNFLSVVDTVAALLPALKASGSGGVVVGFGSIAAARGRGSNLVYSASKRALQTYFEGLRHLCADDGPRVQFYVVGYLDTSLASGRTKLFPKADPDRLAAKVVRSLDRDFGRATFPRYWRTVSLAIRWTPWGVFKKLKF